MRSIDIHAHHIPQGYIQASNRGEEWHGLRPGEVGVGPRPSWNAERRIADMDSLGVDVHVVSTGSPMYFYDRDASFTTGLARACNDEVAQMTKDYPERFAGLATLPMQDIGASIAELERCMTSLGMKGAMIDDTVNGESYDEDKFLPFFKAAEELGAMLLIHQRPGQTLVRERSTKYHMPNTIGNLVDRAVTFASLVFGGVMDKFPDLRICLSHAGGYTCFGIGRMDHGWKVRSEARVNIQRPPSTYLRNFYYDCLTHSEESLRFVIDTVGVDRVVFGTDWPADMAIDWSASWVLGLESLTKEEKEAILWKNLEGLLNI
ncbi:MAG: amidohydrolase [Chloroflexi bacterium]|nr:amidohydrolase [Chloroflexota bacterium]